MFPILASFPLPYLEWVVQIRSYPTMHVLALLCLIAVTARGYRRDIGPSWKIVDPFLVGVPAGMIGAMLLASWTSGNEVHHPLELPVYWQIGNKAAYGGLIAGAVAAALTAWWRGLATARFLDAAAPGLALAVVLARLGCFLGGCCYGHATHGPFAVHFPDQVGAMASLPDGATGLHPTQLYLAAAALGTWIVLARLRRRTDLPPGGLFEVFVALYALAVFAIEFLRGDPGRWFAGGLSHSQWISLALLLGLSLFQGLRRQPFGRAALAHRL